MKKKVILVFSTLLLASLIWYLFIKPSDYIFKFTVKTSPGTVYHLLKRWESVKTKDEDASIANRKYIPYQRAEQELSQGTDERYKFRWNLKPTNDSLTVVTVGVSNLNGSFIDRLLIPFKEISAARFGKEKIKNFNGLLKEHLKDFKVQIDGEGSFPGGFYAYKTITTSETDKAEQMIRNNGDITYFIGEHKLKIVGKPVLEVVNWNQREELITYNFCFPIEKPDTLPEHPQIKFKTIETTKSLKATFNGNYRLSDRAWFALDAYADDHNIAIEKQPIEVFNNDPNRGGNPLEWTADIFMPFKK